MVNKTGWKFSIFFGILRVSSIYLQSSSRRNSILQTVL
jgi:hypothetical protein